MPRVREDVRIPSAVFFTVHPLQLFARCRALWLRFREQCSGEMAVPRVRDADRLPDASTVRRWLRRSLRLKGVARVSGSGL